MWQPCSTERNGFLWYRKFYLLRKIYGIHSTFQFIALREKPRVIIVTVCISVQRLQFGFNFVVYRTVIPN